MRVCVRTRRFIYLSLLLCLGIYFFTKNPEGTYDFGVVNASDVLERARFQGAQGCQDDVILIVAVPVSPAHAKERQVYRDVYAKFPAEWRLLFFLGFANETVEASVKVESEEYGDIVQMDLVDSYRNLTLKSLLLLKWVDEKCPKTRYVLKFDDDVYLNIPNTKKLLSCLDHKIQSTNLEKPQENCSRWSDNVGYRDVNGKADPYVAGGYLYPYSAPIRDPNSKWFLSATAYPDIMLPRYLSGMAYLLSTNLIPHILHETKTTPLLHLEDVYITGLLITTKLDLRVTHIDGWHNYRPFVDDACTYNNEVALHGVYPHELAHLQQRVEDLPPQSCQGLVEWKTYLIKMISTIFPKVKM